MDQFITIINKIKQSTESVIFRKKADRNSNVIREMKCISSCVGDLSSSLGSAHTTDHVTCEEDSELNTSIDRLHLPYSFDSLDV